VCHPEVPAGQPIPEVHTSEVSIPVPSGEAMPALLATPESGAGAPVLIINDVFGRSPFYEGLAARLAAAGLVALDPELFFRQGPLPERSFEAALARRRQLDELQTMADLQAAIDWLRRRPDTHGERTGTIGFCMGGTMVLQLAAERDDLVSVCYYGFPRPRPGASSRMLPAPLDVIDRINGPVLGFWGNQDANVGMDNVAQLAEGLQVRGVDFEHTVYPGLGHGFMSASGLEPGNQGYQEACESWTRTLDFYRRHLDPAATRR
jgi:carboxymethylenebutenolidase